MAKYVTFDSSKAPITVLTYVAEEPTKQEFEEYLIEMEAIYNNSKDFVLVFDATKAKYLSAELRSRQAEWIKDNTLKIKEKCRGMVYILPNIMVEILFKCIVAFSPLPVKYTTVRNLANAFVEAEKILAGHK